VSSSTYTIIARPDPKHLTVRDANGAVRTVMLRAGQIVPPKATRIRATIFAGPNRPMFWSIDMDVPTLHDMVLDTYELALERIDNQDPSCRSINRPNP
jgi:hypothetical protein